MGSEMADDSAGDQRVAHGFDSGDGVAVNEMTGLAIKTATARATS
jgi:hypothetical protein